MWVDMHIYVQSVPLILSVSLTSWLYLSRLVIRFCTDLVQLVICPKIKKGEGRELTDRDYLLHCLLPPRYLRLKTYDLVVYRRPTTLDQGEKDLDDKIPLRHWVGTRRAPGRGLCWMAVRHPSVR